jgi:hypothetical protein
MCRVRDVASTGIVTLPDVDSGHVVGSKWWLGPAVGDVHGIQCVSQLQQGHPKQPSEVARSHLGRVHGAVRFSLARTIIVEVISFFIVILCLVTILRVVTGIIRISSRDY